MALYINKKVILIATVLFIITLGAGVFSYYLKVVPLKQEVTNKQAMLLTEIKVYEKMIEQVDQKSRKTVSDSKTLQERLPVQPLVEQFILDLEKAEVIANSLISSMTFSEGGSEEGSVLPNGLEKVTVSMSVRSPDYYHMETFLTTLEELDRMTKIDRLSFSGSSETMEEFSKTNPLQFSVTVSTFFMPSLVELDTELPVIHIPEPSNKSNPFPTSKPKLDESDEEKQNKEAETGESDQTKTIENEESQTSEANLIYHTVQKGETLFNISKKYFNGRHGEEIIKEWNNLKDNEIYIGQVLKIPTLE